MYQLTHLGIGAALLEYSTTKKTKDIYYYKLENTTLLVHVDISFLKLDIAFFVLEAEMEQYMYCSILSQGNTLGRDKNSNNER